jgi:hypothetical protein
MLSLALVQSLQSIDTLNGSLPTVSPLLLHILQTKSCPFNRSVGRCLANIEAVSGSNHTGLDNPHIPAQTHTTFSSLTPGNNATGRLSIHLCKSSGKSGLKSENVICSLLILHKSALEYSSRAICLLVLRCSPLSLRSTVQGVEADRVDVEVNISIA